MCVLYVSFLGFSFLFVSPRYLKQLVIDHQSLDKLVENHTMPIKDDTTVVNVMMGHFFAVSLSLHLGRIRNSTGNLSDINAEASPTAGNEPKSGYVPQTWLQRVAKLVLAMYYLMFIPVLTGYATPDSAIAHREDFDLKADALVKWVE